MSLSCPLTLLKSVFLLILLQRVTHIQAIVPPNASIINYSCSTESEELIVTFFCSSNTSADISTEIQVSPDTSSRCKGLGATRSNLSTVNFIDCDRAGLPSGLFLQRNLNISNLSKISLESLAVDDLRWIDWKVDAYAGLDLKSKHLTKIDKPIFGDFKGLKDLYLSNNSIRSLSPIGFFGLSGLTKLYVDENKVAEIANGTFVSLGALQTLDLSHNRLRHLTVDTFRGLSSLSCLRLQWNNISELSDGLFAELRPLETLDLSHNRLRVVGQAFGSENRVRHLDLSFNEIKQLKTGDFVHLQWLDHLNLSHSQVESMEIGSMSPLWKLGSLDLSSNSLHSINFDIFLPSFRFLSALHLDGNQLSELNGRFHVLFPQLTELMLARNRFTCSYLARFLTTFEGNHQAIFANPATNETNIAGITCTLFEG